MDDFGQGVVRGFTGLFSAAAGAGVEGFWVFLNSPAVVILLGSLFFLWLGARSRR